MIVVISDETVAEFRAARRRALIAPHDDNNAKMIAALLDVLAAAGKVFDAPEHKD